MSIIWDFGYGEWEGGGSCETEWGDKRIIRLFEEAAVSYGTLAIER
jgi:hypothetical protein